MESGQGQIVQINQKKKILFIAIGSFIAGVLTTYLIFSNGSKSKGSFLNESPSSPALILTGEYKDSAIHLTWIDTTGKEAIGYRIERSDEIALKKKGLKVIKESAPHAYIDTEIEPQKKYFYVLRSFKKDRTEAAISNEIQIIASSNSAESQCACSENPATEEVFTGEASVQMSIFTAEPELQPQASQPEQPQPQQPQQEEEAAVAEQAVLEVQPTPQPEPTPAPESQPAPRTEPQPAPQPTEQPTR